MSIATIINEQIQNVKTLRGFARELELSHSTLVNILQGKRNAGGKVIRALARHPDTKQAMLTFLSKNVTSVDVDSNED